MSEDLNGRIARIAGDRESGASELLVDVLGVLSDVLAEHVPLQPVARALIRAQPSMAPVWNGVRAAVTAKTAAGFSYYVQRRARAPQALVRHALGFLLTESGERPMKLVTISFSGTVVAVVEALCLMRPVQIACAEGHPALEGRRMAERLAAVGAEVTHYADPALGHALAGSDAVLVGADAITPDTFLNKSGSLMLAAAAGQQGVPVYVAATHDKFVSLALAARLEVRDESPAEVWPSPPPGVTVRNPYFEASPLDLISAVISDVGVLGAALVPDACPTAGDDVLMELVGGPT